MANYLPPVVIDHGSSTTRAGFASEDLPSLVFSTNYVVDGAGKTIFGDDEIGQHPDADVMTLMEDGVLYNFDHAKDSWQYVFDSLDGGNGVSTQEHSLMLTDPVWSTTKQRAQMAQLAFEGLQVPLFSLVKTPLAQLYHMGRSTGLVIDIGGAVTSVTPIIDGIVQHKSAFHSKYAGDFLNLHCLHSMGNKIGSAPGQFEWSRLLPARYADGTNVSESFKQYHATHNLLVNFKQTMLHVNDTPPGVPSNSMYLNPHHQHPLSYQLPDRTHLPYNASDLNPIVEALFLAHAYPLPGIPTPEPAFDKASTHGVSNLALFALKHLESSFLSSVANEAQTSSANARFYEILRLLFQNVLITGGTALIPGLSDRVSADIGRTAPQVFPNYMANGAYKIVTPLKNHGASLMHDNFDKKFGSWIGAANLASMIKDNVESDSGSVNIALDNWFVSKAEFEELGEDLIADKFK